MKALTVLYDPTCSFCTRCQSWLSQQAAYVPMRFLPQGSNTAKALFPQLQTRLDEQGRPDELIAIDDTGKVYRDAKAWIIIFYSLRRYRGLAMRFSKPGMQHLMRRAYSLISTNRRAISILFGPAPDLVRELERMPDQPHCNDAVCAMRHAKDEASKHCA